MKLRGACLTILCLLILGGCATVDGPTSAPGASGSAESHPTEDYPGWSRAMGWLLAPFGGGASETVRF